MRVEQDNPHGPGWGRGMLGQGCPTLPVIPLALSAWRRADGLTAVRGSPSRPFHLPYR